MPCNPIHKQIKRSSSRSFWAAVFLSGNGNMDGNLWKIIIKAQGEKNSAPYVPKAFFSLNGEGFPACGYIGGTWKESEIKHYILYC